MIKEARGFGNTIDEAKENEIDKYKKISAAWIYSGEVFAGEI